MGAITRAVRNTYRKGVRSAVVILILAFALCVFISMDAVYSNVENGLGNISNSAASNGITIRPAGSFYGFGGAGGSSTLNESIASQVEGLPDVSAVQELVTHTTGSFMRGSNGSFLIVEGENPAEPLVVFSGGSISITSGQGFFAGDVSSNVALVGNTYASDNSISVNSTISLNGTSVRVIGIFTTGYSFGDNAIILPLAPMQHIYAINGLNSVYVTADSVGNVNTVVNEINTALANDNVDVVSNSQIAGQFQSSIDSVISSTQTALIISVVTAIAVIVFLMVLITRERTQEIGVLKAIGFSSPSIVTQFLVESIILSLLGFALSLVLALEFGPTIANSVLSSSSTAGPGGFRGGFFGFSHVSFSITPELAYTALAIAVAIGIVGAIYPIIRAVTLRPAEALRYE